jgi:glycosyltransferase involved in cell wall biosynthesis
MSPKSRILFGVTTKSHTEIALDEMYGLQELGYTCEQFEFGGKANYKSVIARLFVIFINSINLLIKTYKFRPNYIYLNSRLEYIAAVRDFITIVIIKLFYFRKVNFLIKSHGSDLEVLLTKKVLFSKIIFPFLRNHVQGWLFLSEEELSWIVSEKLLDENKLFLAKNIVRSEKFNVDYNFRKKHNIPDACKILLFAGRMIKEKGIHYVVDAFVEIKDKFNVYLVLIGDGEEFEAVRENIGRMNIRQQVLLTGWIDETTVAYYTSNSDILIFPTYFPEGFPMALFNSMAAGLAVITTPTRAALDYLLEPDNCLWVEPRSTSSIVTALNKLLSNQELLVKMQLKNKEKSKLFTKKVIAQELSAIITSINLNVNLLHKNNL